MRKLLIMVLALCLCVSAAGAASVSARVLDLPEGVSSVSMDIDSGRLIVSDGERNVKWLADAELNKLSEEYAEVNDIAYGKFRFYTGSGLTSCGLMDADGNILVPAEYADARNIGDSDRWAAGFLLTDGTKDDYDYSTYGLFVDDSNRKYYCIDTVDIYYRSAKVATLSRSEWGDGIPYGDYLFLKDRNGGYAWYDKDFVKSNNRDLSEYFYDDDRNVIHTASGQVAFCPECTLTEDNVRRTTWKSSDKKLLDLRGNELGDFSAYFTISEGEGIISVSDENGKWGIADQTGKLIVPIIYDGIYDSEDSNRLGWVRVVKDGKEGFVNLATGEETGFVFEAFSGSSSSGFLWKEDPDKGDYLLICAAAGEMPEHYLKVEDKGLYMLVTKADETVRLIDINGKDVLPEGLYDFVEYSKDGTLILTRTFDAEDKAVYTVYTVAE